MEGSVELEMFFRRTCADLSLLRSNEGECEEDETVYEEQSSLGDGIPSIRISSAAESAETVTRFQNDVARKVLRESTGYEAKRKDGSYVDATVISIARLDVWVATVIRCSVVRVRYGGYRQKEYGDTYARIVGTVIWQIFSSVMELVKD